MNEQLSEAWYASLLYDFYGELLGDSRREVMNLYHEDNLSLTEIAEELGISRQGVHYTLKKAEESLRKYEEKLGLVARYIENTKKAAEAEALAGAILSRKELDEGLRKDVEKLASMIREFTE